VIAFTFPGQGAQKSGMGAPWQDHPAWELVAQASEIAGRDVAALLLSADDEELRQTRNAQLATFTLSALMGRAVSGAGLRANVFAGHSLGEYTALTAAGALEFADAVRLVTERGEAMQVAAQENDGTMAAILGLDDAEVEAVAEAIDELWVANYNAPGQVVIAGGPDAIAAGSEAAKAAGAKRAMALSVGGAFHSPHMSPAQERLDQALSNTTLHKPTAPVWSNVDARGHTVGDELRELLGQQLTSPVRWSHSVADMVAAGVTTLVEIGPGGALTGMARRITSDTTNLKVNTPDDIANVIETIAAEGSST